MRAWNQEQPMCNPEGGKKKGKNKKKKREGYSQTPAIGQVSSGMHCASELLLKTLSYSIW